MTVHLALAPFPVLLLCLILAPSVAWAGDVQTDGKLISTVPPGTPPLQVLSPTWIENLNADRLDGADASAFAPWNHGHPELDPPAQVTVAVDCDAGGSINEALETAAQELIVEISGLCHELVRIVGRRVVLRGTDPTLDGIRPPVGATGYFALVQIDHVNFDKSETAPGVLLENLSITGSPSSGVRAFYSDAEMVNCRIEDNAVFGVGSASGSLVKVVDSVLARNRTGARARSGGWVVLTGSEVTENTATGVLATLAGTATLESCPIIDNATGLAATLGGFIGAYDIQISGGTDGAVSSNSAYVQIESSSVSAERLALRGTGRFWVYDTTLGASIYPDAGGDVFLSYVIQTGVTDPFPEQPLPEDASNWLSGGRVRMFDSTLLGTTYALEWSKLLIGPGSLMDGSLVCGRGGDALCEDASQVSGTASGCELCPPSSSTSSFTTPPPIGFDAAHGWRMPQQGEPPGASDTDGSSSNIPPE